MSAIAEVLADRGGPAIIIFNDGEIAADRYEADYVVLVGGGVMHTDAEGNVRWHPQRKIHMVIWKTGSA